MLRERKGERGVGRRQREGEGGRERETLIGWPLYLPWLGICALMWVYVPRNLKGNPLVHRTMPNQPSHSGQLRLIQHPRLHAEIVNNGNTKGMYANVSQQGKSWMIKRYRHKWTLLRKICSEIRSECIKWKANITGHGPRATKGQVLIFQSFALCGWSAGLSQLGNTALAAADQESNHVQIQTNQFEQWWEDSSLRHRITDLAKGC